VVSSTRSASSMKFHIPQEKATSHYVCIGVCSDHPDISKAYYKHYWKTDNTLHMEMEAPNYVCIFRLVCLYKDLLCMRAKQTRIF
jgi:hypothetical protein